MTVPRCPSCHQRLFQTGDGVIKLRTNILIFKEDGAGATIKCPRCKADVSLDVQLGQPILDALQVQPKRLVVRKILDKVEPAT